MPHTPKHTAIQYKHSLACKHIHVIGKHTNIHSVVLRDKYVAQTVIRVYFVTNI